MLLRIAAFLILFDMFAGICAVRTVSGDSKMSQLQDLTTAAFSALQQERDQLTENIRGLEGRLSGLQNSLDWRKTEAQTRQQLEEATKRKAAPKEMEDLNRQVEQAHNNGGYPQPESDLLAERDKVAVEYSDARKRKVEIEKELDRRVDVEVPKQKFRTNMSIAFTVLVGMVIVGFYALAGIDQILRREMFSRQSGIQFITLFSLVIAIILFGITGILESRELSALLGGLSGYILGRSTGSTSKPGDLPRANRDTSASAQPIPAK
jgi:hypothetical protein